MIAMCHFQTQIFSYSVIRNSFEFQFFFCVFLRIIRVDLEYNRGLQTIV